jgi:hypothetical protein
MKQGRSEFHQICPEVPPRTSLLCSKPDEKGKVCNILHFLIPPCSAIAFEDSRKIIKSLYKLFIRNCRQLDKERISKPRLILLIDKRGSGSAGSPWECRHLAGGKFL